MNFKDVTTGEVLKPPLYEVLNLPPHEGLKR